MNTIRNRYLSHLSKKCQPGYSAQAHFKPRAISSGICLGTISLQWPAISQKKTEAIVDLYGLATSDEGVSIWSFFHRYQMLWVCHLHDPLTDVHH